MQILQSPVTTFIKTAFQHKDSIAIEDCEKSLTYGQLEELSSHGAYRLILAGVQRGDRIAVQMEPNWKAIVVLLIVARAACSYVPIDPGTPPERTDFIIKDSKATLIITMDEGSLELKIPRLPPDNLFVKSDDLKEEYSSFFIDLNNELYIIYTSGTTGKPKGVCISHNNLAALFEATKLLFDFGSTDKWLLFHSLAFDFSVWEMWGSLLTGGTLVVANRTTIMNPVSCSQLICERKITVLNQTPTAAKQTLRSLLILRRKHFLRYIIFGGERLDPRILKLWVSSNSLDNPIIVNMYGITEITVHATFHRLLPSDLESGTSVIGSALPGFLIEIIDENGSPSEEGQLLLAGPQVSRGYINHPELTNKHFIYKKNKDTSFYYSGDIVRRLDNGNLSYLGRIDNQVKIRGYRIELEDVESAVQLLSDIEKVVVVPMERGIDALSLVCAYTTHTKNPIPVRAIRSHIYQYLPKYMCPERYFWYKTLPQTTNGKIDRTSILNIIGGKN